MTSRNEPRKITPPAAERLPALIESLLFVAEGPQEVGALARSLGVSRDRVERALEAMDASRDGRGVFVQRMGDLLQLATTPDAAPYIEQLLEVEHGRLSRASLETLAIIAYRQPMTRATIESVRGVNSDHAVGTLLTRGLVQEVGRAPGPGRPVLLGTAVRFLEYFGLQRPEDLPPLPHVEDGISPAFGVDREALSDEGEPAGESVADQDEHELAGESVADADDREPDEDGGEAEEELAGVAGDGPERGDG